MENGLPFSPCRGPLVAKFFTTMLSHIFWIYLFLFKFCSCEELPRNKRAALNKPQYQIIPRAQRRNYWEYSYEDFGTSYEDEERAWLDGDFGLRSTNYKQKIFSPHKTNRRQRNMKHKYSSDNSASVRRSETDQDNEILGSGNFVVIKGGTFYGQDRGYLRKNYGYPKNYGNYYGGNQFQNFRDFADLKKQKKGDRRRFF